MNTVYFQGIAYTREPTDTHDCPAGVRDVASLLISELETLHTAITKRLYGRSTPSPYEGVEEGRKRVWNLLLEFHDTVNVKMDRTWGDSFHEMVITISRRDQKGGPYGPVPDAPSTFGTEQKAHTWVQNNMENGFDYLVVLTAERPIDPISVSHFLAPFKTKHWSM